MSTRCHVMVLDENSDPERPILLYRHTDGYEDGVRPTLDNLCSWIQDGAVGGDAEIAAGWLILFGLQENLKDLGLTNIPFHTIRPGREKENLSRLGGYEPCSEVHGDVSYLHIVDAVNGKWHTIELLDTATRDSFSSFAAVAIEEIKASLNQTPDDFVGWPREWQPIETAPRDQTKILLWWGNAVEIGRYDIGQRRFVTTGYRSMTFVNRQPTHWLPLPTQP